MSKKVTNPGTAAVHISHFYNTNSLYLDARYLRVASNVFFFRSVRIIFVQPEMFVQPGKIIIWRWSAPFKVPLKSNANSPLRAWEMLKMFTCGFFLAKSKSVLEHVGWSGADQCNARFASQFLHQPPNTEIRKPNLRLCSRVSV
jgi:hypothetical protein